MYNFQNFNHLLTTAPHDIYEVFISDLHLSEGSPLVPAFLALLNDLAVLPNLKRLYILGDWFDVWIGDDDYLKHSKKLDAKHPNTKKPNEHQANHWITPIVDKLKQMRIDGCETLVLTGNRDFLMRQPFCNTFAGTLLEQPYFIKIGDKSVRLEHGDALCTDDKSYQRFRKYAQHPIVQWWLLSKSLAKRQQIADKLRNKSKQANQNKSLQIMDVNATAVRYAFTPNLDKELITYCKKKNKPLPPNSDILIHGHTHRPAVHMLDGVDNIENIDGIIDSIDKMDDTTNELKENPHIRYVLGDWRLKGEGSYQKVSAVIGATYRVSTSKNNIVSLDKVDDDMDDNVEFGLFEFVYQ